MRARRLVLASASPTRLRVLQHAGFAPEVVVTGVPEDLSLGAVATVTALAERKASAVDAPDAVVLGCDSIVVFEDRILGKPSSPEEATAWWRSFRDATVTVWTGHCVIAGDRRAARADSAVVRFASPTEAEIDRYVASGEPMGAAGAFRLDGRAAAWIDAVVGDPGTVHGLSVRVVRALLTELDIEVTDLWA